MWLLWGLCPPRFMKIALRGSQGMALCVGRRVSYIKSKAFVPSMEPIVKIRRKKLLPNKHTGHQMKGEHLSHTHYPGM